MICTYCQTKQENKKICSFCEADLTQERPKKKQTLSQEEAYQTQPELSKYHTYDLLLLLSYLREQRSTAYKTMQSVRKAPNEVKTSRNDYEDRKSTRLNSSHVAISYAVFCLKKKQNAATDARIVREKERAQRRHT